VQHHDENNDEIDDEDDEHDEDPEPTSALHVLGSWSDDRDFGDMLRRVRPHDIE
jgi:hypothetical protein